MVREEKLRPSGAKAQKLWRFTARLNVDASLLSTLGCVLLDLELVDLELEFARLLNANESDAAQVAAIGVEC